MKISVITPSFNSSPHIAKCIQSVNSQQHTDVEHIFVDNLSTDETCILIQRLSKRNPVIKSEKDRGISDAFNKGINLAKGEIIAILNSDDEFFSPLTLTRVHDAFARQPELSFVHGNLQFVDHDYGSNIRRPLQCPITTAMPFNHPAFFVRRSFYERLGLFDENYRYAMDFELICRMYSSPDTYTLAGKHLDGAPLSIMHAGGASWKYELKSLEDCENALKKHGHWNSDAEKNLRKRRLRVQLKQWLARFKLNFLIRIWRFFKWKSHEFSS